MLRIVTDCSLGLGIGAIGIDSQTSAREILWHSHVLSKNYLLPIHLIMYILDG